MDKREKDEKAVLLRNFIARMEYYESPVRRYWKINGIITQDEYRALQDSIEVFIQYSTI